MLADAVAASVDDGSGDVLSLAEAEGVAAADLLADRVAAGELLGEVLTLGETAQTL